MPTSNVHMQFKQFFIAVVATCYFTPSVIAGVVFLGPTPYGGIDDSPFASREGGSFYLEDFEDGVLNTPGIFQPIRSPILGAGTLATVSAPGDSTDSVDADDGIIDGSGTQGHSLQSRSHIAFSTFPARNVLEIIFEFDEDALGSLPFFFGVAITDVPELAEVDNVNFGLQLFDSNDLVIGSSEVFSFIGDGLQTGDTSEDVFLGAISDREIARVRVFSSFLGSAGIRPSFEIDHVQYGVNAVPEPSTLVLLLITLTFSSAQRNLQHRVKDK